MGSDEDSIDYDKDDNLFAPGLDSQLVTATDVEIEKQEDDTPLFQQLKNMWNAHTAFEQVREDRHAAGGSRKLTDLIHGPR